MGKNITPKGPNQNLITNEYYYPEGASNEPRFGDLDIIFESFGYSHFSHQREEGNPMVYIVGEMTFNEDYMKVYRFRADFREERFFGDEDSANRSIMKTHQVIPFDGESFGKLTFMGVTGNRYLLDLNENKFYRFDSCSREVGEEIPLFQEMKSQHTEWMSEYINSRKQ